MPAGLKSKKPSKLRMRRLVKGYTIADVAEKCGVSQGYLSELERNGASPTIEVAKRIAKFYGASLDELFGG